uniref:Uncharacterized protein n=1 Tax=Brassica campestris TaxID=3711 RepID=A0A3P5YWW2_BRACM|nr:unnamed protein product [Brassica rapa]
MSSWIAKPISLAEYTDLLTLAATRRASPIFRSLLMVK